MSADSYKTIQAQTESIYKDRGSKFLAFAYPVQNETEIKDRLAELRKKYYDANHHCFAWVLGADRQHYRAVDDGEPNHSAGDPILGQLKSHALTHTLIVVVRYFGGVKLGVGGLISAYREAAAQALAAATIVECEVYESIQLVYSYTETPEVMRLVKDFELQLGAQTFTEYCTLMASVKQKLKAALVEKVSLMNALGNHVELKELKN